MATTSGSASGSAADQGQQGRWRDAGGDGLAAARKRTLDKPLTAYHLGLGVSGLLMTLGRLLVLKAAWTLDRGDRARTEISMAKVQVADTLHLAADTAVQLQGARGYSKDTVAEWIYRYARQARLVDGASEVHEMVIAQTWRALWP